MYQRNIFESLEEAMGTSPVVLLIGARQTGKSTLMDVIAKKENATYVSFDDISLLAGAQSDPVAFINDQPKPLIIDEVQRFPELFVTIKRNVDKERQPGKFVLTGSANPLLLPRLSDSLAGRMELLQLWPLSQGELIGRKERFIDASFSKTFSYINLPEVSKREYMDKIVCGGYPAMQSLASEKRREAWCHSYINTLLVRDLQELAHIERLTQLPNLLQLLATRSSSLLNVAELSRSCGIPVTSLHRYIELLHSIFIIHFQPPWFRNLGKRLVKSPKIYFVDTGLLTHLIGADTDYLLSYPNIAGNIVENFVVVELQKQATWNEIRIKQYHYRSSSGDEVDIVLENAQGNVVGIEVKSSETVKDDDFKGLRSLQNMLGKQFIRGIVLYLGNQRITFGENMIALPMNALWEY